MKRRIGIYLLLAVSFCTSAFAQSGVATSAPGAFSSETAIVENARYALDYGMPALAQMILANFKSSSPELNRAAALVLADALISNGDYAGARKKLAEFAAEESSEMNLRRAIVSLKLRDDGTAKFLARVKPEELSENLLPWYNMSRGALRFSEGDFALAREYFIRAKELAKAPATVAEADAFATLCSLSQELKIDTLDALAEELAVKSSVFMGTAAGAQYAKQYAIVLDRLGMKQKAGEIIDAQLQTSLMEEADRDELRLIGAYVDSSVERRRLALLEILKATRSPEITGQAVRMLRNSFEADAVEYERVLLSALNSASDLIKDRILLELAYVNLRKNNSAEVSRHINKLLSDYPASAYTLDAHRILAFSAFSSDAGKKPDYRLAANQLLKVAALDKNQESADIARFIAADSYFLEKDYETAVAMYEAALNSSLSSKWKSGAFSRAVESLIALGRIDVAAALLDSSRVRDGVGADDVWSAEWSIASAYRDAGESQKALARIDRLLAGPASESADAALRVRLLWLQVLLSEISGDYSRALLLSNELLNLLKSGRLKIAEDLSATVVSNTMFMRARQLALLERLDGDDGAFAAYDALRAVYPNSEAAQLSYLYEARIFADRGLFAQAQNHCKTLIDNFPQGKYAAVALLDAAMYSQKLGLESDNRDAMQLLDKLVKNYPDSPKVFDAKLAYAQILREMNDYANAAAIYKNMLEEFSGHPRIAAAEMGLGDCLFASGTQDSDAASVFERLYSAPSTPREALAEIAYKWGFALDRAGRKSEAVRIWWISAGELLENKNSGEPRELAGNEAYWLARSLLTLGRTLEKLGETRSAISAYELMIKHNLPASHAARERLLKQKKD